MSLYYSILNSIQTKRSGQRCAEHRVTVIGEETGHWRSSYSPNSEIAFKKSRLRLLQLSNKPAMLVAINRFSSFYIAQQRILSCVHFRFCGLDFLHVAHQSASVGAPLL